MMKKILITLLALLCYNVHSQEITDTILYAWEECDHPTDDRQDINFILDNDSLWIEGDIEANCCGFHFLIYEIINDTILLTKLDTGEMCDCYCLFEINQKIRNCTADSFRVILTGLGRSDTIDTLIIKKQVGIFYYKKSKNVISYPNPFSENTILHFPYYESDNFTFVLFDNTGRIVRIIKNITSDELVIEKRDLNSGAYYFQIFTYEKFLYSGKLIVK